MTQDAKLLFQVHEKGLTSYEVAQFLRHLMRKVPGKLLVIWDRGGIHRGEVDRMLSRMKSGRIKVAKLPPYAPELNPQEGIWHLLKDVEMKNLCCSSLRKLRREFRLAVVRLRHKRKNILACFDHAGCKL